MSIDRSAPPPATAIRAFEVPHVAQQRLDNGVTLLSARRGEVPLVSVRAVIDAGATAEQAGEEGLAWLTAHALEGGTTQRSGEELAWAIERLGAELVTATTWDAVHVALTTRSDRLGDVLGLLAEIVRAPLFAEREVQRLRDEQRAEILRRSTEPRALADDSAAHFIFSREATYARTVIGHAERVAAFSRDSVIAYHRRHFTPAAMGLVIVGDVDAADALHAANDAFGDWQGTQADVPAATATPGPLHTTIYLVDRPSAVQSELRIGHVGLPRHHADYYALLVMNALVGGAFTSRLNLSLREKHGFTYGVRSGFAFRRGAGPFVIQTAVASDVTARAVEETLRELREIQANGVTEDEVRAARDYIAGTLPLEMQTTDQLAARIADLHTFSLPPDYLEHYRERIAAVTRDDVLRAARTHVQLDRLAIVVVGNAAAVEDDLRALGVGEVVRGAVPADTATTG